MQHDTVDRTAIAALVKYVQVVDSGHRYLARLLASISGTSSSRLGAATEDATKVVLETTRSLSVRKNDDLFAQS